MEIERIALEDILVKEDEVVVQRALLEICLGLLEEADKHVPITGSSFDDDLRLAKAQLRLHLK